MTGAQGQLGYLAKVLMFFTSNDVTWTVGVDIFVNICCNN